MVGPQNKKNGLVQLNTNVPAKLKREIQKLAIDLEISMTELVTRALSKYLEEMQPKNG